MTAALDDLDAEPVVDDLEDLPLPPRPPAPGANATPDEDVRAPDISIDSISYSDPLAEAVARAGHAQPCRHCRAVATVDRRRGRVRTLHAKWCPTGRRAALAAIQRPGGR